MQFFKSNINISTSENILIPYELGITLQLCISLVQPISTRGRSIINDEIEQEIIDILKDAQNNERSLYYALRYEFF